MHGWEEKIDVAIINVEGKHRNPTIDDVIEELIKDEIISDEDQVNKETGTITTNEPSYEIIGKLDDYVGITAEIIANSENKDEYYGKIVENYDCQNSEGVNNWKILYADKSNIYLIADDYISKEYVPNSKGEHEIHGSGYGFTFHGVYLDYEGSKSITDERVKLLNKKYHDYLNENNEISTEDNIRAVAYMLDTDIWGTFAGNNAEYAIGGPTIELLFNSYNEKYQTDNKYQTRVTSKAGYEISGNSGNDFAERLTKIFDSEDSLYVINVADKADGMWVASPSIEPYSAGGYLSLYRGDIGGSIVSSTWNTVLGFRPVVCLKSDVKLKKQDNDNYIIY